jgi:amylosucrase
VPRILLLHAVLLGFGGLPTLWMGDELGLLNDVGWADDEAHAGDNRWAHRQRLSWRRGLPEVPDDRAPIREGIRALVRARATLPHLHAARPTEIWDPRDPGVLLVVRRGEAGPLLMAANVTGEERWVTDDVLHWLGLHTEGLHDAVTGGRPTLHLGAVRLAPYQVAWLYDRQAAAVPSS